MIIFPAIDLYGKKAVRLFKGDYSQMTVYNDDPVSVAEDFARAGASHIHIVDLEGARDGSTPNIDVIKSIVSSTGLEAEVGGGIRSFKTIEKYLCAGIKSVILGTAAADGSSFLSDAVKEFGSGAIIAGADIKDGRVAIKGWTEASNFDTDDFFSFASNAGIKKVICTDISRDGAMRGANTELYVSLMKNHNINIIASGGVSSIDDIKRLSDANLYGAIIGKAYYEGVLSIEEALRVAGGSVL